jgi:hypothetical protein
VILFWRRVPSKLGCLRRNSDRDLNEWSYDNTDCERGIILKCPRWESWCSCLSHEWIKRLMTDKVDSREKMITDDGQDSRS